MSEHHAVGGMARRQPTEAERDERIALDGDYTLEGVASVLLAVHPEDLHDTKSDIEPEADS